MSSEPDRDRLLNIEEAAARTRLPVATLRFYRHKGTGPRSAKLGRRVIYREADLDAWIEAQFTGEVTHGTG
jgi:predicted DNA-binding transcriptional regulator AlpA